jgi:hypothetical protein
MAWNIRPLSFSEILDRSFRVLRNDFVLLVGVSMVLWLPYGLLAATGTIGGKNFGTAISILNLVLLSILGPIMNAALTVVVAKVYLGTPIAIAEAYRSVRAIIVPIIGTYLLIFLIFMVAAVVVGGGTYLLAPKLMPLAIIGLVIPTLYLSICWALIGPVMIVERHFGMAALHRSRDLVRGSWWATLGILFVAALIADVPALVLRMFWSFIPIVGPVLTAATQAISGAYGMIALVVYYFDRRCRTEDFDLRLLAEQIRAETASVATTVGSPSIA